MDSLLFAAEDYCADVSIKRAGTRVEMLYARSAIVTAAKAYGLKAIDLVRDLRLAIARKLTSSLQVCVQYKDFDVLREECEEGHRFGFDGKVRDF